MHLQVARPVFSRLTISDAHTHIHAHTHKYTHTCIHTHTHKNTQTRTHAYIYAHAHTHTHTHTRLPPRAGVVVWLNGPTDLLAKRVADEGIEKRPLLASPDNTNPSKEELYSNAK